MKKQTLTELMRDFINQRPGFDLCNYDTWANYQSDYRPVLKAKHDAHTMLSAIEYNDAITADDILKASESAYSGRLSFIQNGDDCHIDYCTGQYFPTEYRNAVCAVLSSVLWRYFREHCHADNYEAVKKQARLTFGKSLANRWFN